MILSYASAAWAAPEIPLTGGMPSDAVGLGELGTKPAEKNSEKPVEKTPETAASTGAPQKLESKTEAGKLARGEKIGEDIEETKNIAAGVEDILEFDFTPRYTVGKQDLLKANEGNAPNQIRVYPLKPGITSLVVIDPQGKVRRKIVYNITKSDLSQKVMAVRELLYDIEGIVIKSVDEKIVIDGELIVPKDLERILIVQSAYPEILNLVTLSKLSREAMGRRMQKEINDDPMGANVTVRIKNDTFFLMGTVDSEAARQRAQSIAETYLPEMMGSEALKNSNLIRGVKDKPAIRNLIIVEAEPPAPAPKMVRITYHFVEIVKNYLNSSMFKWNPLNGGDAKLFYFTNGTTGLLDTSSKDPNTGQRGLVGTISNLLPKLKAGTNGGFSRVLYSTVGIGLDGQPITINRKQSIPYIATVQDGVPVPANQDISISFDVTPTISGEADVDLKSTINISVPTGAGGGGGPVATQSSVVSQTIRVKSGESAALGGFISSDMAKDVNKDPEEASGATGTGLFSILRSKAFKNNKTQFVAFVTPKIIDDASQGTADIKKKFVNTKKKRLRQIN